MYWVPALGSLYKLILSITQEPTIRVPGLLALAGLLIVREGVGFVKFKGKQGDPKHGLGFRV